MAVESNLKPTLNKPVNDQSKGYQKGFDKAIATQGVKLNEFDVNPHLNEIDGMLDEAEQSLKKKIFSLAKMEALVFSDPKLSAIYEEMAENGEEKYGYHYNETIMNILFNEYVLKSPKYLDKYKITKPVYKKRRDKSGIKALDDKLVANKKEIPQEVLKKIWEKEFKNKPFPNDIKAYIVTTKNYIKIWNNVLNCTLMYIYC
jgi:hypothetical protein